MKLKFVIYSIKTDFYRYYGRLSLKKFVFAYFYNKSFRYSFWFRFSKIDNACIRLFAKIKLKFLIWDTGIDIPPRTTIGNGMYIGHPQSIVINPNVKIGDNCNISQFVSIGSNDDLAAIIGNNVYIGPLVSIVGNVFIGNNVTIGAGSVVVKDIPDNATVAGVPAKILNFSNPGRYIRNVITD